MDGARRRKLNSELQRALAELLAREVKDPRVGNVTITAVDVAPDLASARVHFLPFGAQGARGDVQAGLERASGFLRGQLGRRLRLRRAPRLDFVFDSSIDEAQRLSNLIDAAVHRES